MPRTGGGSSRQRLLETDSPLHAVLRQKPYTLERVQAVLDAAGGEDERRELVNRRDLRGDTPLLVAIGHISRLKTLITPEEVRAVVDALLDSGAGDSVQAYSRKRQTASEQARGMGLHGIAARLSELEKEKLQENTEKIDSSTAKDGMCGARGDICTICGDKVSVDCKIAIRREAVLSGEEDNPLIRKLFEGDHIPEDRVPLLSVPALHHVNRRRNFSKEFTDSLGVFFALQQTLKQLRLGKGDPFHVVDLCCGKGFTAALVAIAYPNSTVTAVDKIRPTYLPHYEDAGLSNVHYERTDILSDAFVPLFRELIQRKDRRPVLVLGMHLCGALSLRAVDLLAEPEVLAVLVAPCCLPGRKTPLGAEIFQDCEKDRKFEHWCDHLERRMLQTTRPWEAGVGGGGERSGSDGGRCEDEKLGEPIRENHVQMPRVERLKVEGMIAQKNTILSAVFSDALPP